MLFCQKKIDFGKEMEKLHLKLSILNFFPGEEKKITNIYSNAAPFPCEGKGFRIEVL